MKNSRKLRSRSRLPPDDGATGTSGAASDATVSGASMRPEPTDSGRVPPGRPLVQKAQRLVALHGAPLQPELHEVGQRVTHRGTGPDTQVLHHVVAVERRAQGLE